MKDKDLPVGLHTQRAPHEEECGDQSVTVNQGYSEIDNKPQEEKSAVGTVSLETSGARTDSTLTLDF